MAQAAARSAANIDQDRDQGRPWVGRSIERVEDAALLSGRGRFNPYVYFNDSRDTLYVVMYTTGISLEEVFIMRANG